MQLRWYQQEAIESVYSFFANNKTGNPLIALPTGTGKSLVIAGFCKQALNQYPATRIIVATHSKELVKQNYEKMAKLWPRAPIGIFSAGLKSKETIEPIIFGGIDSMVNCAAKFGRRDLLLVDEAHLVSPKDGTRYQKFINDLRLVNPRLRVIGLTATAFRAGMGSIIASTKGAIFTDICYNMCDKEGFARLLAEGHLAPLVPRKTSIEVDLSNVGIASNGDFKEDELSRQVDKVTYQAILETLRLADDKKHGLIFTSGVENTIRTAAMLNKMGLTAVAVHSNTKEHKMTDRQRDDNIALFVNKKVQYIVNNNILTTGFDAPHIDLIVMLRATLSSSLWVQMLGRGTRPCDGKTDCLVLDFARNTARLGPIDDPVLPQPKGSKKGDAPIKICNKCETYNHASVRYCCNCGEEFIFKLKFKESAANMELMRVETPIIKEFKVSSVFYKEHITKKGDKALKITYQCDANVFTEYLMLENKEFFGSEARRKWRERHETGKAPPDKISDCILFTKQLKTPTKIKVWTNKKYPEIMKVYHYDAATVS